MVKNASLKPSLLAMDLSLSFRGMAASEELVFYARRLRRELEVELVGPMFVEMRPSKEPGAVDVSLVGAPVGGGPLRIEMRGHPFLVLRDAFETFARRSGREVCRDGG